MDKLKLVDNVLGHSDVSSFVFGSVVQLGGQLEISLAQNKSAFLRLPVSGENSFLVSANSRVI